MWVLLCPTPVAPWEMDEIKEQPENVLLEKPRFPVGDAGLGFGLRGPLQPNDSTSCQIFSRAH